MRSYIGLVGLSLTPGVVSVILQRDNVHSNQSMFKVLHKCMLHKQVLLEDRDFMRVELSSSVK